MKATIDLPDALYRQVKARSALEGRAIRDVTTELFRHYVEHGAPVDSATPAANATAERPAGSPPAWLGLARGYLRTTGVDHDWPAVRESIERGWAGEVAEPGPRRRRGKRR